MKICDNMLWKLIDAVKQHRNAWASFSTMIAHSYTRTCEWSEHYTKENCSNSYWYWKYYSKLLQCQEFFGINIAHHYYNYAHGRPKFASSCIVPSTHTGM